MSRMLLGVALMLSTLCGVAVADGDTADHLREGESVGAFYVTKVAGAEEDGVEPGDHLCYRCRYGSSPMVMVFARRTSGNVCELVKQLDTAVTSNEEHKLRGLLTLMGEDAAFLKDDAKKIALTTGAKRVPIVIAEDTQTGPANYRLSPNVDVTIVVAKDSQVVSTLTFPASKIDLVAVMRQVKAILN